MYILGINAYHGDASATLLKNGEVVLAIEEERLNRKKHCAGFPYLAIEKCLEVAEIDIGEVDHVAISTDPSANLREKIVYSLKRITKIHKMLLDRLGKVQKTQDLRTVLARNLLVDPNKIRAQIHNIEHHLTHLACAFYASPFKEAALLSLDGMGDFVSAKWAVADKTGIHVKGQVEYPHSIGYLYTAITQFLGFPYYGDEGKVMGLAPYGNPVYLEEFRQIIQTDSNKMGYALNLDFFRHHEEGIDMKWDDGAPEVGRLYSDKLISMFGPAREPGSEYTDHYKNIAASLQRRVEEVGLELIAKLHEETGSDRLGLAGGVALNSVMNGKIIQQTPFNEVYIHPNAGDGGTSLGAALWVYHEVLKNPDHKALEHPYLGVEYSEKEINNALGDYPDLNSELLTSDELFKQAANSISEGLVVGWFQGRMEWGPRALGGRSIVADPRRTDMKDILNSRIKKREAFRPFAPSVLKEETSNWFEQDYPSPAMLMVYQVKAARQKEVPAITHVDGSGRLQTVEEEHNYRYYHLIKAFFEKTGVPMVLNTSFNENEPIVCTPKDAIECFVRTKMDILYIGNFKVTKSVEGK